MLLSLIIILALVLGLISGYHRGLIGELIYVLGYFFIFSFAKYFTHDFADYLMTHFHTWSSDRLTNTTSTNAFAFVILFLIGWLILRVLIRVARVINWIPVISQVNGIAGAVVALILTYCSIFILLSISQFIPNDFYQEQLSQSMIGQSILSKTPDFFSQINDFVINTKQTENSL